MPNTLKSGALSLATLRKGYQSPAVVALSTSDQAKIQAARDTVLKVLEEGRTVYGINTGFGLLARTKIAPDQLGDLQRNLVLSHMAGVGDYLEDDVCRLVLILKILSLAKGHSGVRIELVETLNALLKAEVYPCIPEKGSVGASGDLAPLAHLSGVLLGVGKVRHKGKELTAEKGLEIAGLKPMTLEAKEGLALLNGTQVSNALALSGLFEIEKVFAAAMVAGALSVDAAKGSDAPFTAGLHEVRGQKGQIAVAKVYRSLLAGSAIRQSHLECERVQDPYCLRCQPQVMGAILDQMEHAADILLREAGAVSDNPIVFADSGEIISGGNFHGEPVAMAADNLAIALAEIGNLSERRTALLMDEKLSGLPAFLINEGGLNSGFMIAQVTAAALASENKQMAGPASVDTIPTSANQEDHVSMATFAARRLHDMAWNAGNIVAVEILAALQGIDFHAPLKTSKALLPIYQKIRSKVPNLSQDRPMTPDIEAIHALIRAGEFEGLVGDLLPSGPRNG
ncbi:MAG: histidine ammonia-lyase [Sphingomonadales bacterium]